MIRVTLFLITLFSWLNAENGPFKIYRPFTVPEKHHGLLSFYFVVDTEAGGEYPTYQFSSLIKSIDNNYYLSKIAPYAGWNTIRFIMPDQRSMHAADEIAQIRATVTQTHKADIDALNVALEKAKRMVGLVGPQNRGELKTRSENILTSFIDDLKMKWNEALTNDQSFEEFKLFVQRKLMEPAEKLVKDRMQSMSQMNAINYRNRLRRENAQGVKELLQKLQAALNEEAAKTNLENFLKQLCEFYQSNKLFSKKKMLDENIERFLKAIPEY